MDCRLATDRTFASLLGLQFLRWGSPDGAIHFQRRVLDTNDWFRDGNPRRVGST